MTTERLWDRPRIILPGPAGGVLINAGCMQNVELHPSVPMQGPWWFGMLACEELHVQDICFADQSVFDQRGAVPSHCFDVRKLECLIPLQARAVDPGQRIRIEIYNWSCATVQTTLVLWGTPMEHSKSEPFVPTEMDIELSRRGMRLTKDGYWR